MSANVNKAILVGRLGKDPEMRYAPNGTAITTASLATSRNWTGSDGQKKEATQWRNIQAWAKLGEILNSYGKKGRLVYVEGEIEYQTWEKDGVKHYKTIINAKSVQFLDKNGDTAQPEAEEAPAEASWDE